MDPADAASIANRQDFKANSKAIYNSGDQAIACTFKAPPQHRSPVDHHGNCKA